MAKKPNYNFEKRTRETDKKAKQEQKLARKREAAEQKQAADQPAAGASAEPAPADPE